MKTGLLLGGLTDARSLGSIAAEVEALGYDSLWAGDHVSFPAPILDPLQLLACYASHTERIRLGTCVYLLPLRHPTVVAKMVSSLDFLAGGRVTLGIGVGGEFPGEFRACGVPLNERGARANEAIAVLRKLWKGEAAPRGRFFDVGAVKLSPAPPQGEGLPIWVGGRSDAALRRAARRGDGYVGYMLDAKRFSDHVGRVRDWAGDAGRSPGDITAALMAFAIVDRDRDAALARAGRMLGAMYGRPMESAAARYCIAGTADDCRGAADAFAAAGCEHLILAPLGAPEALRDQIHRLGEALGIDR